MEKKNLSGFGREKKKAVIVTIVQWGQKHEPVNFLPKIAK
jgi:hypothetical protein